MSRVGFAEVHIFSNLSMNPASSNINQSQENLRALLTVAAKDNKRLPLDHFLV